MRRIASTKELQAELNKLLAYSKEPRPSRKVIATELTKLAHRLAGEMPEAFKKHIEEMKEKGKDDEKDDDED